MNGEHATTEPTTALTTIEPREVVQRIPLEQDIEMLGRAMVASGFFKDTKSASQAMVKILAGKEIGLPPIAAMTGIHIIEGKISLGANLIAAAVKRSGRYNYRVREHSAAGCRIEFFEHGESVGVSEFTMADAQAANLTGKAVWRQYPRNMLFARALTNGARWYCADVFGGAVYTPEELDHDERGPYVVQSVQEDYRTGAPTPAPMVEALESVLCDAVGPYGPCVKASGHDDLHAASTGEWVSLGVPARSAPEAEDEPPSAHTDATLAADLDAAFQQQAAAITPRYPKTSAGQAAFLADCKGKLGLDLPDIKAALGGSVREYMQAQDVTLDEVYTVLVNKSLDNVAVPGRLGATVEAE